MPLLHARVENHTVCYLRNILVARAHKDPDLTSFLTMWNLEEYWTARPSPKCSMPTTSQLARVGSPRSVRACPGGTPGGHLPSNWARLPGLADLDLMHGVVAA
jgi:hypothetical protein